MIVNGGDVLLDPPPPPPAVPPGVRLMCNLETIIFNIESVTRFLSYTQIKDYPFINIERIEFSEVK